MTHLFYMVFEAQQKRVLERTIHASRDLHGSPNGGVGGGFDVEPPGGLTNWRATIPCKQLSAT
jgi:hypothetical protein